MVVCFRMEFFVGQTFHSHEAFVTAKKNYEDSSNSILTIYKADKISSTDQLSGSFKYLRCTLRCKAGPERKMSKQRHATLFNDKTQLSL